MRGDETVFSKAYGLASMEYLVPNTTGTRFNVASVSKQFSALGIVKLHLAGKLSIDDTIDQFELTVPPMLLQPLVENSIKYAVNVQETGCVIDITTRLTEDALILSVSDNGPGIVNLVEGVSDGTKIEFSGVGLKNIFDRLQNVYGGEASVTIDNKKGKGLTVTIRLPRLKS